MHFFFAGLDHATLVEKANRFNWLHLTARISTDFDRVGWQRARTWKGIELLGSKIIYYFVRSGEDRRGTMTPIKFIHLLYQRLVNSRQTPTVTRSSIFPSTRGRNPFLRLIISLARSYAHRVHPSSSNLLRLFVNNLRDACAPLHLHPRMLMDAQFSSPLFSSAARNLIIYSLSLSLLFSSSSTAAFRVTITRGWRENRDRNLYTA